MQATMNFILNRRLWLAGAGVALLGLLGTAQAVEDARVFELRTYVTNEGKLPDLLTRFRDHTCKLFEKHGMENIGYWVPVDKENGADNTLIYIIAHKSRDAAKASWDAFRSDPDWKAAAKASEANGKILAQPPGSVFMNATDFSPAIKIGAGATERVFELRTYTTPPGKLPLLHARFRGEEMKLFTKQGMTHIGYFKPTDEDNKMIYILAHPSKEAGLKAFDAFRADPDWIKLKAESEKDGSLTLPRPEGVKSVYMKAVDFSPIK